MANRTFFEVDSLEPQIRLIEGTFEPAGSTTTTGAPVAMSGSGWTVTHDSTSTGQYDVLLADDYPAITDVEVSLQLATAADAAVVLTGAIVADANANKAAGSGQAYHFAVTYLAAGTAADLAANASNLIHFVAHCKNTTLTP